MLAPVLLCPIGEQHRLSSFRMFVHDCFCLAILYCTCPVRSLRLCVQGELSFSTLPETKELPLHTNMESSRHVKREKASLPIDLRRSKTSLRCWAASFWWRGWSRRKQTLGRFSNRTGTSVDDGARKSNNWLDKWHSGKWGTGSRV